MHHALAHGLVAGAAGTTALNVATYLDMAVRGRPSSAVPARAAERFAARLGLGFGDGEPAEPRKEAVGALLGYGAGVGVGAACGLAQPLLRRLPRPLAATVVGLGTMAVTDTANAVLGTTDPREWSAADWASDVVPHLVFGAATAAALDLLDGGAGTARR
jgi:hypothetical protein